jgi:hypothetical protein
VPDTQKTFRWPAAGFEDYRISSHALLILLNKNRKPGGDTWRFT